MKGEEVFAYVILWLLVGVIIGACYWILWFFAGTFGEMAHALVARFMDGWNGWTP